MSSAFAIDVIDSVIALRHHYDNHLIPSDTLIGRARAVLNGSERLVEKPSEEVESDLDYLYGLFTWARLVSSPAYLDPRVLGWERTKRRLLQAKRDADQREREEQRLEAAAERQSSPGPDGPTPAQSEPSDTPSLRDVKRSRTPRRPG
jgi:hypothetical protein